MVNLYLARHGQDEDNAEGILNGHRDRPLTYLGREQAREVGKKMKEAGFVIMSTETPGTLSMIKIKTIYTSPLQRAHETAKIFAETLSMQKATEDNTGNDDHIQVEVLQDLIERNFGVMTGLPTSSIVEKCGADHILATEKINYFLHPEGAETFPDLILRAKRLLSNIQHITANYDKNESILLVTHGDFGKMLYAAYYGLEWEQVLRQFHFGNSEVLLLSEDSPPEKAHVFETTQFNA